MLVICVVIVVRASRLGSSFVSCHFACSFSYNDILRLVYFTLPFLLLCLTSTNNCSNVISSTCYARVKAFGLSVVFTSLYKFLKRSIAFINVIASCSSYVSFKYPFHFTKTLH